jgi:membrane associated rhomboid family serine protease
MLIPIRTETSIHRTPWVNVGLLLANVAIFLAFDLSPTSELNEVKREYFTLNGSAPRWFQYLTYQFAHADVWHLVGNMLFLWVFGNGVNAKMRDIPYLLFYLTGGAFAGVVYAWTSPHLLIGASGAIAAVTSAYLVLFPRARVTVLYVLFFIGFVEIPAMIVILLKIIIWDNILAPAFEGGQSQIAYSAHLAGYFYGLIAPTVMLLIKAIPRDQFDMLALLRRWRQRWEFRAALADPRAKAQAEYGRVARARPLTPVEQEKWAQRMDEVTALRASVAEQIRENNLASALKGYETLIGMDANQCLPADQQMRVAREYYDSSRYFQAAAAFERYLKNYRNDSEANEVRLLLGIIAARDLRQFETAERHLEEAIKRTTNPTRREQAERWLAEVRAQLGKPKQA